MKIHVNYADGGFFESQKENSASALSIGCIDQSIQCGKKDIDADFLSKNAHIFANKRGAGYWLWKPYIINKHLNQIGKDDYLIYTDSGMLFVDCIDSLLEIERDSLENDGILLTETTQWIPEGPPWKAPPEYMWTKRDAFLLTGTDKPSITHSTQANAAFLVAKPREKVFSFLEEWMKWGSDIRAITDIGNCLGLPNYEGFMEHRHDQSLMSILAKKYGFRIICDMTQWGQPRRDTIYKTLLDHNRKKN